MTEHDILESIQRSAADTAVIEPDAEAVAAPHARDGGEIDEDLVDEVEDVIDAETEDEDMDEESNGNGALMLPERVLHGGIRRVQEESARGDVLGVAARAILSAVHVPAVTAAEFFARLERETVVVARAAKRRTGGTASPRSTSESNGGARRGAGTRSRAATAGRGRARHTV